MKPPSPRSDFFSDHPPLPAERERAASVEQKDRRRLRRIKPPAQTRAQREAEPEPKPKPVNGALVWCEPPQSARTGNHLSQKRVDDLVAQLQQQPGKWALVGVFAGCSCMTSYKRRGVECTTRLREDGKRDLYARWPKP